ncbi:MAG: hypothetical protein ACREDR_14220 [Blastocatellia bacterium]
MSHDQLEEPERANTGLPHRGTGYTPIAALESAAGSVKELVALVGDTKESC